MDRRKETAERLFAYIYEIRYERRPFPWEWIVGWALIEGSLVAASPVKARPLAAVHCVADDVRRALGLVEKSS